MTDCQAERPTIRIDLSASSRHAWINGVRTEANVSVERRLGAPDVVLVNGREPEGLAQVYRDNVLLAVFVPPSMGLQRGPRLVYAPFTRDQVAALDLYQNSYLGQPYTCPMLLTAIKTGQHGDCRSLLQPTPAGLRCRRPGCVFVQVWAFEHTTDLETVRDMVQGTAQAVAARALPAQNEDSSERL